LLGVLVQVSRQAFVFLVFLQGEQEVVMEEQARFTWLVALKLFVVLCHSVGLVCTFAFAAGNGCT
jgi:hypothetical protein